MRGGDSKNGGGRNRTEFCFFPPPSMALGGALFFSQSYDARDTPSSLFALSSRCGKAPSQSFRETLVCSDRGSDRNLESERARCRPNSFLNWARIHLEQRQRLPSLGRPPTRFFFFFHFLHSPFFPHLVPTTTTTTTKTGTPSSTRPDAPSSPSPWATAAPTPPRQRATSLPAAGAAAPPRRPRAPSTLRGGPSPSALPPR